MKKKKKDIRENDNNEKVEIIDDDNFLDDDKNKKKKINKNNKIGGFTIFVAIIAILSFIAYVTYEYIHTKSIINSLSYFIGCLLILLFIICFIVIGIKSHNRKISPFIILGSLIIITYSTFNILLDQGLINLPHDNTVINFYKKTMAYANKWGIDNNIDIDEIYEYSDIIPEYHIIAQDIETGKLIKDINKITLIISLGPDFQKEIIVPSFIGWEYEDVIKYIENNHLNNIDIEFQDSTKKINTVISQSKSGTLRRNDNIKLIFAKDEFIPINIIDLENKSLLYATSWLKMHGFKYEIKKAYNDTINKNFVIKQNYKNEVKDPLKDTIELTISKGKMIIIPDIKAMNKDELNNWVMNNNLKISYTEIYSEDIISGDIIDVNYNKGDAIEIGDTIKVSISKGKLEMIKLTNLTDFYMWADENKIKYEVIYEYSNTIKKDDIIKASHETGKAIKDDDTVIIYVSKGKSITLPNFVSMSKTEIEKKCNELNLSCSFTYGGYTETTKKDIALKQSKNSGVEVAEGTNLVITLSSGIYEKVTIPSLIGKTKTEANNSCKNIGITCNFTYETNYSNTTKDIVTKQSKTGTVNKGTSITVTLSKGPAKTYTIVIDPNQLTPGNAEATKKTLQTKLKNACPNVTFTFTLQKANSAIGYLAENSQVKVGQNTFTEGKTYKVIINSN